MIRSRKDLSFLCLLILCLVTLPSGNVSNLGLAESAGLDDFVTLDTIMADKVHGLPGHDVGQDFVQEVQDEAVYLFEFEEEGVVTFGRVDVLEYGVGDCGGEFFLLGVSEEAVGLDTQDECRLFDQGESVGDGSCGLGVGG